MTVVIMFQDANLTLVAVIYVFCSIDLTIFAESVF